MYGVIFITNELVFALAISRHALNIRWNYVMWFALLYQLTPMRTGAHASVCHRSDSVCAGVTPVRVLQSESGAHRCFEGVKRRMRLSFTGLFLYIRYVVSIYYCLIGREDSLAHCCLRDTNANRNGNAARLLIGMEGAYVDACGMYRVLIVRASIDRTRWSHFSLHIMNASYLLFVT